MNGTELETFENLRPIHLMGRVLKPEIVAEDASDFWLYVDVDRGGPGNRNGEQRKKTSRDDGKQTPLAIWQLEC